MMGRTYISDTKNKIGEAIQISGWVSTRRDHGGLIFIDLRDRSGIVQVVFTPKNKDYDMAQKFRSEWVLQINGKIQKRPENMINKEIETGGIEIAPESVEVLSEAQTPPFALDTDGYEIGEEIRMKYRYLDLRRPRILKNLILRHQVIKFIRDYLSERGFLEIETPILTKSTPEGARDYVVPSRLYGGKFYALPQSPQQYKQLLMVAGIEKYFQIPRCFRDEDTRGDRQPEFTQLDLEMSFVTREDILDLTESLCLNLVKTLCPEKSISTLDKNGKIPRLLYSDVMAKYGSDKPDLRENKNDPNELAFAFVVDFPMFEKKNDGSLGATHHPFTKMKVGSIEEAELLKSDPEKIVEQTAEQYDFILNGYEIGGGSIREHNPKILEIVFEILGHTTEQIHNQFGHLLRAFSYGVPPHGGIAPGIDRLVMILQNEPNIREVIAFPKTGDARDLMMNSPSELSKEQLLELHLHIEK